MIDLRTELQLLDDILPVIVKHELMFLLECFKLLIAFVPPLVCHLYAVLYEMPSFCDALRIETSIFLYSCNLLYVSLEIIFYYLLFFVYFQRFTAQSYAPTPFMYSNSHARGMAIENLFLSLISYSISLSFRHFFAFWQIVHFG